MPFGEAGTSAHSAQNGRAVMTGSEWALAMDGNRPAGIHRHLAAAAVATVLADYLLYKSLPGLSVTLAFAALAAVAFLANPSAWTRRKTVAAATALFAAALLPGLENTSLLSLLFAIFGTAIFALAINDRFRGSAARRIGSLASLILAGPFRLVPDLIRLRRAATRRTARLAGRMPWSVWVVPAGLGAIFLTLFASANPLIENWLSGLDVDRVLETIDLPRIGFWLLMVSIAWPFIRVRARRRARSGSFRVKAAPVAADPVRADPALSQIFGPAAILRSLIVFNALFAVQSALDLVYLWGGVTLPDGMSYARYAHRGAYPLIATALLAGGFVLAAMRPGSASERNRLTRALVYAWTGQNVLLVVSAILRLNLYVEVYSLTLLRVAAFIWMMLVALGLVLIVARIALNRSNGWLISLNGTTLAVTLYACCFVNFPHMIASYNVAHSREFTGTGVMLDHAYLARLGPAAIPALDLYMARAGAPSYRTDLNLPAVLNRLAREHREQMADWRGWSFRGQRLLRYLDARSALQTGQEEFGVWEY
jgi:hypothetical protein